jgi:uncharacterized RDD family membrane protein YckC
VANVDATTAALDRMAASYVPTTGPSRPTLRERRAQRRPPKPLPGLPATVGRRLAARLIDSALALVTSAGVLYLLRRVPNGDLVPIGIFLGILFAYEFLTVAIAGRTLGKWIMELRVVSVTGYRAPWWSAAVRAYLPYWLNMTTFGVVGAWCYRSPIGDDSEWKRGWPDRAARTVVVYQRFDELERWLRSGAP